MRQHGVYTLLLDYQYATEKPIMDIRHANLLCHSNDGSPEVRSNQRAVRFVLKKFFPIFQDGGFWNKRVLEEIKFVSSKSKKAKVSAETRHERDKNATQTRHERDTDATLSRQQEQQKANENAPSPMRTHSERTAILDSRLQTLEEEKESKSNTYPVREFNPPGLEKFLKAYPNNFDEKETRREWFHIPFVEEKTELILAGLEVWKKSSRWENQTYIPSGAKFLRDKRWEKLPPREPGVLDAGELEKLRAARR